MTLRVVNAFNKADRNKLIGISDSPYTRKKRSKLQNDSYCRPSIFKIRNPRDVNTINMIEIINVQINKGLIPFIVIAPFCLDSVPKLKTA